jgi:hypothetical protein
MGKRNYYRLNQDPWNDEIYKPKKVDSMTLTKQNAKLELFKVNRKIEKLVVAHANELGQFNKNCLMNDLQRLWDKKKTIQNTMIS